MNYETIIQFQAKEDGCIYFYDDVKKVWKKICDIPSPCELPHSVRTQIREAKNSAEYVLALPLEV